MKKATCYKRIAVAIRLVRVPFNSRKLGIFCQTLEGNPSITLLSFFLKVGGGGLECVNIISLHFIQWVGNRSIIHNLEI